MLECRVSGPGGSLCTVSVSSTAPLVELKAAIEASSGIHPDIQRLFLGRYELRRAEERIGTLVPAADQASGIELLLVRRTPEQRRWIRELQVAGPEGYAWFAGAAEAARADREVALSAVAHDGRSLEFASPELRADAEVVL